MPQDAKKVAKLAKKKMFNLTDAEWEARGDAYTLMEAERIKSDPKRLSDAKLWAAALAQTEQEEATAFNTVANG